MENQSNAPKWEYAVISQAPTGPIEVTITHYQQAGAVKTRHQAASFQEGTDELLPNLIAQMGQDGWELVSVTPNQWHFKRRLPA